MRTTAVIVSLAAFWMTRVNAQERPEYTQQQNVVVAESHGLVVPMDIFTPRGPRNGRAIIDVASGAWHSDRGKIRDHEKAQFYSTLCGRGYVVFAVRPGSISRFHAGDMVANIEAATRWVQERAEEFEIDPAKMGITGASAGGHLASLVALATSGPDKRIDSPFAAAAVFFPPTDFTDYGGRMVDPRGETRYDGIALRLAFPEGVAGLNDEEVADRLASISPVKQVHPQAPPFLLIHGDADEAVPLQQSRKLLAALEAQEVEVELIVKPGGGHPWPTIHEEVAKLADWFDRQLEVHGDDSNPDSDQKR